jgi:hypothetical protein
MVSTDDGRESDLSHEHVSKAELPRLETLEPDSNVPVERFLQSLKQK